MLAVERQIFVQRSEVKEMKRKLGIKDDDEDLINQKVGIASDPLLSTHILTSDNSQRRKSWRCQQHST